jgi:hypothetical protein
MKRIFTALALMLGMGLQAQNGANEILIAPNANSPYILVDTLFTLENYPAPFTDIYIHFANPTATPVKAVQFRLYYDNTKFSSVGMFWGPTAQPIADKYGSFYATADYINVVAVYTGANQNFGWTDGAMFKLRLTHGPAYVGESDPIFVAGTPVYPNIATIGSGLDIPLGMYSYGGGFQMTPLTFPVKVKNADGSAAQGLYFTATKKLKNSPLPLWLPISTDSTNALGEINFVHPLDTAYWNLRITAQTDTVTDGGAITITDAYKLANHVTGQDTLAGIEWYEGDVNQSQTITISDGFSVFNRLSLQANTWNGLFPGVYNVSMLWPVEWNAANAATTVPNWTTSPRRYQIDTTVNGMDTLVTYIYVVGDATTTGYNSPATILAKLATPGGVSDYILDPAVYLSNKPDTVQFRFPKLTITADNFIDVPVTMYTFGNKIGAVQMGFEYDTNIFEFVSVQVGEVAAKWTSLVSVEKGRVFWAGHEDRMNPGLLEAMSQAFTFRFRVKTIQGWTSSPLRIFNKAAGDEHAQDLSIKPSPNDGSIVNGKAEIDPETLNLMTGFKIYPNPVSQLTDGWLVAEFYTEDQQNLSIVVATVQGEVVLRSSTFLTETGFQARGIYLGDLPNGAYVVRLVMNDRDKVYKLIKF